MAKETQYDAIVVGARCAGSPTGMLLARKGYKVLVVDRERFGSDTLSTHIVHPPGIAALERWGLLDRLIATGCPPVPKYTFDFGPIQISGRPRPVHGVDTAYGPRRTILDKLLVDAAGQAGAEMRERFTVEDIVLEGDRVTGIRGHGHDGKTVTEHARVVIGADGRHSFVAKKVGPEKYNEKPPLMCGYYTYWSGLPTDGFETFIRPERGFALIPTHDDLTVLVMGWPYAEFEANRGDVEGNYLKTLELAPVVAERVRAAKREAPFRGAPIENFYRKPFGPGWALVGDAGHTKDPITGMGINDAWHEAELCTTALDEAFTGARDFDEAMGDYQRTRDEDSLPMYELTTNLATLAPPPPELQQILGAAAGNQEAMDAFVSMLASTMPVPEFFSEENVGRIMSAAGALQHG
jgi:2-polyprenyl-6-methoxyphenol hydroxylase-like FAD-dependent oxidoreductase